MLKKHFSGVWENVFFLILSEVLIVFLVHEQFWAARTLAQKRQKQRHISNSLIIWPISWTNFHLQNWLLNNLLESVKVRWKIEILNEIEYLVMRQIWRWKQLASKDKSQYTHCLSRANLLRACQQKLGLKQISERAITALTGNPKPKFAKTCRFP